MSQSSYTMKMKNTFVEYKKILCSPDSTNFTIMKNLLKKDQVSLKTYQTYNYSN